MFENEMFSSSSRSVLPPEVTTEPSSYSYGENAKADGEMLTIGKDMFSPTTPANFSLELCAEPLSWVAGRKRSCAPTTNRCATDTSVDIAMAPGLLPTTLKKNSLGQMA